MFPELDIDLLRTFVAVVESGSFTKASRAVFRSQATGASVRNLWYDGKGSLMSNGSKCSPRIGQRPAAFDSCCGNFMSYSYRMIVC